MIKIEHFRTLGFIVRNQLFSEDEIENINPEFTIGLDHTLQKNKSAAGERGQFNRSDMNHHTPYRLSLMEDSRIDTVVEQLLEKNGLPANFNRFNGDGTEWHPDLASPYLKRTKFFLDTNFTLRIPNPDNRSRKCIGLMITVRFHRVATLCERTSVRRTPKLTNVNHWRRFQ